jgi:hypothetical protein
MDVLGTGYTTGPITGSTRAGCGDTGAVGDASVGRIVAVDDAGLATTCLAGVNPQTVDEDGASCPSDASDDCADDSPPLSSAAAWPTNLTRFSSSEGRVL